LHIFPAAYERSELENITENGKLKRVSVRIFSKLVSNFNEANKKLIIK
jgi:hypothetical protein